MKILKNTKRTHPNFYAISVAFAVVAFWRGVWGLLDIYLFPGNEVLSFIVSTFIGLTILYMNDFKLTELTQ